VADGAFASSEPHILDGAATFASPITLFSYRTFLASTIGFLILADTDFRPRCTAQDLHCSKWVEMRVKNNPAYKTSTLGMIEGRQLLLVQKVK
jgi:hypothetical protein